MFLHRKKFYFLLLTSYLLLVFSSCRKGTPSWDADFVLPLINSSLTIDNIIPETLLHTKPDNSLELVYNTKLYSYSTVTIPDTTVDTVYFSPTILVVYPCTQIIPPNPNDNYFDAGSVQLSELIIHSGKLQIALENKTRKMLDVEYLIPKAKDKSGIAFDKVITVPAKSGTTPGKITSVFDLSGYNFDLRGQSGTKYNSMVTETSVKVNCSDAGKDTIFPGDNIKVSSGFIGMVPEYAKGYFGSSVTTITDSTSFSLFKHIIDGTLKLQDIDIDFNIENNVGVDARLTINNLSSVNSRTKTTVALQHSIINSPINVTRALDNNGTVTASNYTYAITPSNSNILPFVNNMPDELSYKMQLEINPLGNNSGSNDFIYRNKLIKTEMNMTIPLSLIANNLTMADTVNFNLGKEAGNVNHGNLYLYADNGFPFSAEAQLYLLNDKMQIVDSLISAPNVILAPSLDANYICIGKKKTKLTIPVDENKMALLQSTKKMYLKIKFNTSGQPNYVKIYSFYAMNVKLVGDFNYTFGKK
ncbi:MAG: hypothetical protein HY063_13610 [Bacteroidetes bacterium]|nr:hypothetical protein [Bacteroidota bacterium]